MVLPRIMQESVMPRKCSPGPNGPRPNRKLANTNWYCVQPRGWSPFPDVHAPTGLLQFRGGDGRDGDLVDVAASRSPSLQKILRPVSRTIARLPPVSDKFARYFKGVAVIQTDFLAAEGAPLTLILLLASAAAARRAVVLRIIHRVLYATRAAFHDGLLNRSRD